VTDAKAYDERVGRSAFISDPVFGVMTARPIAAAELAAFKAGIGLADFKMLTTDPVKGLYGQRALVNPALVDLLMRELGLRQLVMVPQEITTAHILARLPR
jgi:hypothetical protein